MEVQKHSQFLRIKFNANFNIWKHKISSEYFFMIFKKNEIDVVALRYFNPVGSHSAYEIFEDPYNGSENLILNIQAAIDSTKTLSFWE